MFYSHTILARKGPLGTVWFAAHLQNRLTKSQYTTTNIRSTVERIMFPEVPIALRMSGHLLLGVVRIYSKQVEYLHKECNVVFFRIKDTFSMANVNLPENASHAPFHSITLPETFELDALEFEDDFTENGFDDKYKKNLDEITITDQIAIDRDPYVAFIIDEDVLRAFAEDDQGSEATEEDCHPPVPEGIVDYGPAGADDRTVEDMETNVGGFERGYPGPSDRLEPDVVLEKQIQDDKEAPTPGKEPQLLNPQEFPPPPPHFQQNSDENISVGRHSPDPAIQSVPDLANGSPHDLAIRSFPRVPKRKRRQHFDTTTVLTNAFMKRSLAETNDIKRVLRNVPCSSLEVWRSNKRLRRKVIFDKPLLSGLSGDLANCFKPKYISKRARGVVLEPETPDFTGSTLSNDTDIITAETSGYRHGFEHTPIYDIGESSGELDFLEEEDNSPESLTTPKPGYSSKMKEGAQESDRLSKKKEVAQESDRLSTRARATAKYLKGQSSATPMSGGPSVEDSYTISLNTILEGKTRKKAARMFFEILALQNASYVKVLQEEAYGDIRLNVLSKHVDDL